MKVLVLAEYYPRARDPVRGVWTHRQTLAAQRAGAEVRVLVLHRPIPPLAALRRPDLSGLASELCQPASTRLDGVEIEYLRYLSPPRPWSYSSWGAWAAPPLKRRLRSLRERFPFELVHAHYAVPAGDAIRRTLPELPMVLSVHGHDVYGDLEDTPNVGAALSHARLVLANSAGTAARSAQRGARATRVVHLGADIPEQAPERPARPMLVTVAHLAARKRHRDVLAALAQLKDSHPELRYVIVGDGPERDALAGQAASLGVGRAVEFRGALTPERARAAAQAATLFVMPSVDEAFGVAYVEAMAAGVPAIGCRGQDGPEEIAAAGGGIELVRPREPQGLAETIDRLLSNPAELASLAAAARATVAREFTWQKCGEETVRAYRDVLAGEAPTGPC